MFDRFSDLARRMVVLAQEEARLLGHTWIGTEHLLVALSRSHAGPASDALVAHGLTPPEVRAAVRDVVGSRGDAPSGHMPFTPRAKTALEEALRLALEHDDRTITPVHLLLALLDEDDGVAAQVVDRLADDRAALRADVEALLNRGSDDEPDWATARGATLGNQVRLAVAGPGPPRPVVGPTCAFCGREEARLERVVVARGTIVCAECIAGAAELVDAAERDGVVATRLRFRRKDLEPVDPTAARDAIELAFEAVFPGGGREQPDRRWAVEDYEGVDDDLAALAEGGRHAPMVVNDVTLERIRFVGPDAAEVSIGMWMAGNQQPMLLPGRAVLVADVWKVSGATVAWFAQQARMFRRPPGPFRP